MTGFIGVVNNGNGTAAGVFDDTPLASMDIAGKTGTAQVNAPAPGHVGLHFLRPGHQPAVRGGRVH